MDPTKILEARSESDYETARLLFEEYARGVGVDICFQGFAEEFERLPEMYGPPRGRLLLARRGSEPIGCVALRALQPDVCEMKRLYVRPEARGHGLGRTLVNSIIELSSAGGYRRMVLETLTSMTEARALYRSLGFAECAPYYANPQPDIDFMELNLREHTCTETP
jgi:ribosomal protein S18 acetylase RimI-like enzyme